MASGGSGKRAPDADPLIGQVIADRYRVVRRIGRGGMGAIYEVQHLRLRRSFALKRLSPRYAEDAVALARFHREADVVASLRHPNVVEIIDWETLADGSPCMIMELLRGEDLGQRLRRAGPLPWPLVARFGDQMLSALQVAHRAAIVHRDLKPQNLFLVQDDSGDEHAKLLDFGVSKIRHGSDSSLTGAHMVGTPSYMSPEQASGQSEAIGPASDVWAGGAILYAMASARHAFQAENTPAVLYRVCHGEPDPLARYRPDAPPAFVRLVGRALSRDPAIRIIDAAVLRQRLREALAEMAADLPLHPTRAVPAAEPAPPPPASDALPEVPTTLSRANGEVSESLPLVREPSRAARLRTVAVAFAATVVVGGVVVARYLERAQPKAAPAAALAQASGRAAAWAPLAPPTPAAPAAPASRAAAPAPVAASPPIEVFVDSTPHADVYGADDRKLGRTPLRLEAPAVVRLERPGFKPARFSLDGLRRRVELRLERLPSRSPGLTPEEKEAVPAPKDRSGGFLDP